MGGEPLLRPQFADKVIYYAAKKSFWVYVPTNARLLRSQVIDWLADAGVASVNFAVDVVDEKPGLPKALAPVPGRDGKFRGLITADGRMPRTKPTDISLEWCSVAKFFWAWTFSLRVRSASPLSRGGRR